MVEHFTEFFHHAPHIVSHTVLDTLKLVPFLFITYLLMEFLEHKAGDKTQHMIQKAGKFGPLPGALLGMVPQCGFSAAAANLYAGRVISVGTLFAIFLSTSDEMIPILLAQPQAISTIGQVLGIKVLIACVAGFVIDLLWRRHEEHDHDHIHELCEHEHCNCEKGVVRSALFHTLQITLFILLTTFVLNLVIHWIGEDTLASLVQNRPFLGPVVSALIGLIPNCASSVVLTQLFVQGAIGMGSLIAGLLVGAGVGLMVLFRVNENRRENLQITGVLYGIGVVSGIILELIM